MKVYLKQNDNKITATLKRSLRDGDHVAYGEVYLHFWDPICRFLRILTRCEETAKEMTQDIFLKLWLKRDQIDPDKSLKSFLYTIARNEAIKKINHQKVEERYLSSFFAEYDGDLSADTFTLMSEVLLITKTIIRQMPNMQRNVMVLYSEEGLNADQIADKLNISKSTVSTHLCNARRELRKVIPTIIFFLG